MEILTLNRHHVLIDSSEVRLDAECRAARWIHHRLLDFEDAHQRVLDEAAEAAAPGIIRVGRLLAWLARRARWAARATEGSWKPKARPKLVADLQERLVALRAARNADPRWKAACRWADDPVGDPKQVRRRSAKDPSKVKRRKHETEEAYRKRFEHATTDETDEHYAAKVAAAPRRSRRETYRIELYDKRSCYWGTYNAMVKAVDQARQDVLKRRKLGLPAEWRRPKYRDPVTLAADKGGFRIIDREGLWWTVELRLGVEEEWARLRVKGGNWHTLDEHAVMRTAQLTRHRDCERWSYSLSLTVEGVEKKPGSGGPFSSGGRVSFDWGHREFGHDRADEGIRVFTWEGKVVDAEGVEHVTKDEVLLPPECRRCLDEIDQFKSRLDTMFDARKKALRLPEQTRYGYRRRLMQSGVKTEEEQLWLRWETRYERRLDKRRKRFQNLRRELYLSTVRKLRLTYKTFVFEKEVVQQIKDLQTDEMMRHRARANRDLSARYEFVSICERLGAEIITVSSRNTTRECPEPGCDGLLPVNGPELIVACPKCGRVRDKDYGAASVIMRRGEEVLADHAAE